MNKTKSLLYFIGGALLTILVFLVLDKCSLTKKSEQTDFYLITNQITKMNKMVVLEQDFTSMQKTKASYELLGSKVSENQIITFTKTNAQVSYDLNKMKIDVDSIHKKLIIKELPKADIRITPSVEIKSMDDSFFNRIDENQIKKVTETAKQNAIKNVNKDQLQKEAEKQLLQNLNQIFVLAKALNYSIIDQTNTFPKENL